MAILLEAAVRVTALALGVALVLRLLRIRSPRMVHRAWTAVLVVMLLLPAIVALGPQFTLPLLPASSRNIFLPMPVGESASANSVLQRKNTAVGKAPRRSDSGTYWASLATDVYFAGVGLCLLRLGIGLRRARAIRREASETHARLSHPACITPMTIGLIAPAVILPPDWSDWDPAELAAVLAHEEEHARRRDTLVAAIALLNRAIFWFHPLAWWLQREIGRLSEQACDAVVIARGHDSDFYAACLLRFARRAAHAGGRVAPIGMAIPGAALDERLILLARPAMRRTSRSRLACAALTCAAMIVVCAAAVPTAAPAQNVTGPAGQVTWRIDTSEHFEIFHEGLAADRVADAIGKAEAAYAALNASLKHDMPQRVAIVLIQSYRDLAGAVRQYRGPDPINLQPTTQRLVISLESLDQRPRLIMHELTHQFAFEIVPGTARSAPVLIEGLAEHEGGAWSADAVRVMRSDAIAGAIPTVASLGDKDLHWAHAMFDFVADQHGDEGVRRLLFALRARESLAPAVPMAFGITVEQFDQAFRGYVTNRFGEP